MNLAKIFAKIRKIFGENLRDFLPSVHFRVLFDSRPSIFVRRSAIRPNSTIYHVLETIKR